MAGHHFIRYFRFSLNIALVVLTTTSASADCNKTVSRLRTAHLGGLTLCELQSRYQNALASLKHAGVQNPAHSGNIFATRFINKKDWTAYLGAHGDSEFAAWRAYSPAPATWGNWVQAVKFAKSPQTVSIFRKGSVNQIESWLLTLHKMEMNSLLPPDRVGRFRTDVAEIIPLHFTDNAYTAPDIESVSNTLTGEKLMRFQLRACDNLDTSANGYYFKTEPNGPLKACGDLTMTPPEMVLEQMHLWAAYVQNGFRMLSRDPGSIDIVEFASTAQQWFVVVHPFVDGNGRTSRMVMERVLDQFGLPDPVLDDMDRDFFSSPQEWADLIGKGIVNSVEVIEACAKNPSAMGCKEVSDTPP